ncbi:MAG: efflux RND transporter permease subunit [Deltaproteobacteria bacterium]|nr:efflux RND transporter permease subunit [Deltaproteobacteria bacterium]
MTKRGGAGRLAAAFIESKLTPLIILAALLLGGMAVMMTPREEEPQIIVPMMDVLVRFPGAGPSEVESRITSPMERKLWEIPGVKYLYSMSRPGLSIVTVRFRVGENVEDSLVKLYDKLASNADLIPPGASPPLVKPKSINDVPILALTLWGKNYHGYELRRIADETAVEIKKLDDISEVEILGGRKRTARVLFSAERLSAYGLSALGVAQRLGEVNRNLQAGSFSRRDRSVKVEIGSFLRDAGDLGDVVVGVWNHRPVYLRDVAEIKDGPNAPDDYLFFGTGPAGRAKGIAGAFAGKRFPAVTIDIAKRKGTNAVSIARAVKARVASLRGRVIPDGVHVTWTRNYGATAQEKSNELMQHLLLATVSVTILIGLFLGFYEALVVAVAVPVTLAMTLFISMLLGYTLNRVTLFALIFAIGILVDDAIVVVENIHRHYKLKKEDPLQASITATDEVGNPTILATLTVIAALLPMVFISGLMGPYMEPIPINSSVAMVTSLLIAFIVTPWLTYHMTGKRKNLNAEKTFELKETRLYKLYHAILCPLVRNPWRRWFFLTGVTLLLFASMFLVYAHRVRVKMLPFDNKSEFQVIIDMPEGTTLETTSALCMEIGDYLATVPEVTDYEIYTGTHAPINFNGLVRHYFLRRGPNVAGIQVNLLNKHDRKAQSHDIAVRVRPKIQRIAKRYNARVKIAEVPPGPPVLSSLVAEVYGPDPAAQRRLGREIRNIFDSTPNVVDVDWYEEDPQPEDRFVIDREKASLLGVSPNAVTKSLRLALAGMDVGLLHLPREREAVPIRLRFDRKERSSVEDLTAVKVMNRRGKLIPLSELVQVRRGFTEPTIFHKNQKRVVYVTGDMAGSEESPVYGILDMRHKVEALATPDGIPIAEHYAAEPLTSDHYSVKWDGEWQITYEVFRDMGIAFAAVLVLIYILIVGWFRSFVVPLIIMAPIPLTLIGILPGHWITGSFFTATSMIGFIALAGIIVRNSILLVDFIQMRKEEGASLTDAVLEAGAVRFRPILLTALALIVGALVILLDPIFQGLAISLIFGIFVSTVLTLIVIPLLYYMVMKNKDDEGCNL